MFLFHRNSNEANFIIKKFNYPYFIKIHPIELVGILWIGQTFWILLLISYLLMTYLFIVLIKGKHISWFGTFIYGFSHQHLQNQL